MPVFLAVIDEEQSAEWLSQFRLDYGPDLPKLKKARTEVMKVCVLLHICLYMLLL